MTIVLAIGGNSLILDPKNVTVRAQYQAVEETVRHIVPLIKAGHRLVIVHGNGPQVGFILRRGELASSELHQVPLDSCVADTQGAIGYNLQMALFNEMKRSGIQGNAVTLVSQVKVAADDPAFKRPSKPIGSFMDAQTARLHQEQDGWQVTEDAGRGFRRIVPSPKPQEILELSTIEKLVKSGTTVIAAGGGGIPVVEDKKGQLTGIEAVIDKDSAAALLANNLDADMLIISTAVPSVYIHFGSENQQKLKAIDVKEAEIYIKEGHFAKGSMLPKIEAAMDFLSQGNGDRKVLITNPENLSKALAGEAGTLIS
jgi:carbamate kinase